MNIIQKAYNWFNNLKTPKWLKILLQEVQDVLLRVLIQVGKDYVQLIQEKIIAVSKEDWSNERKFKEVFEYGKWMIPTMKDSILRLLIEVIVNKLKGQEAI
jgi:hypothetical protein